MNVEHAAERLGERLVPRQELGRLGLLAVFLAEAEFLVDQGDPSHPRPGWENGRDTSGR